MTLPDGSTEKFKYDTLRYGSGHVHQVRSGERVVSDFERDDLHREVQRTQGWLTQPPVTTCLVAGHGKRLARLLTR